MVVQNNLDDMVSAFDFILLTQLCYSVVPCVNYARTMRMKLMKKLAALKSSNYIGHVREAEWCGRRR